MKAVVLTGLGKVEVRDVPRPERVHEDDILVKVGAVGICGSDTHYYLDGRIGDQVVNFPAVIGHECAGVVESVGSDSGGLKPGDVVAIDPAVVCGRCDQCRGGRPNTCRNLLFLGTPGQLPGSMCEFIVMPRRNCYPLPAGMRLEDGVLVEPLSIALHSLRILGGPVPGSTAILGAGPIGLSVLLAAMRQAPGGTYYVTDKIDARVEAARRAGASWAGNPDRSDIAAEISLREPLLVDTVFECSGDPAALDQAVELLRPGGRLVVVGIPPSPRISIDIHSLRRKEITFLNVRRQRHSFSEAVEFIAGGGTDPRFMLTHRFGVDEAARAFELTAGYRDGVIKTVIRFP